MLLLATDLEGMLGKTVMEKLLMVPVHKKNKLDLLHSIWIFTSYVKGYAFNATGWRWINNSIY